MTAKRFSSAKIQAEYYERDNRITFAQYCKFLLSLPIGMSYELWSYLQAYHNGDVKELKE